MPPILEILATQYSYTFFTAFGFISFCVDPDRYPNV